MGQQQLLLLVLGIVIVGLAVVAGINAFDENQQKSSQDALTNEAFRLASDAKAWYNKPTQYDGGGSGTGVDADEPTWAQIGAPDAESNNGYDTPWGTITKSSGGGGQGSTEVVKFTLSTNQGGEFGTVTFDPGADEPISFAPSTGSGGQQGGGGGGQQSGG